MGCYPLFACQDWSQLSADLENIEDDLIALSLVTDPFGEYTPAYLQQWVDGLLTTPDELLWVMPGAERPSPMPPKILANEAIDGHHALSRP